MESLNIEDKIPVGTAEDLTGKTYNRLTVLFRVKNNGATHGAKWRCLCSCGNVIDVLASNLKTGHTLSCGCLQKEKTSKTQLINEIGNKYGRLTVLKQDKDYISKNGRHRIQWICQCDCGKIVSVDGTSLRKGSTQSCGCYRKEQVSNRSNKKYIGKTFHYITVIDKTEKKKGNESIWKCKCNLCNNIFYTTTGKLTSQISCGCIKDSYGVTIIKSLLNQKNIPYESEKIFDSCIFPDTNKKARFDFYVNNSYIIEFDGKQHFSYSTGWNTKEQMILTQNRDKIKNQWCLENNIPLIRIPYYKQDDLTIEDLLIETSPYRYKGVNEDIS